MNIEITDEKLWKLMSDEEKFGLTQELQARVKELEERQMHEGQHTCNNVKIVDALRAENERLLSYFRTENHGKVCQFTKERDRLRKALEIIAKMRGDTKNGPWTIAQQALNAQAASNSLDNCTHGVIPRNCAECFNANSAKDSRE